MNIFIRTLLYFCFLGGIATASDLQQQQNPLYPYRQSIFLQDDFITGALTSGAIGSLGWSASGTVAVTAITGRPGALNLSTGAVSGTVARLSLIGSTSPFIPTLNHAVLFALRLNNNDANTTVRVGVTDNWTLNPAANGIYLEKLDADTNWFCVQRSASVQTRTDSGVAVTTNVDTFAYNRNSSGVQFSINNVAVCGLQTLNIPTTGVGSGFMIINSAAASKSLDVDYAQLIITGLTR